MNNYWPPLDSFCLQATAVHSAMARGPGGGSLAPQATSSFTGFGFSLHEAFRVYFSV